MVFNFFEEMSRERFTYQYIVKQWELIYKHENKSFIQRIFRTPKRRVNIIMFALFSVTS